MEIVPVLLRSVIIDGAVSTVSSDPAFEIPPFSELELRDMARRIPSNGRFTLLQIATGAGLATAAARVQAEEFFFYFLKGEGAERLAPIPAFCLSRGDRLPLATPAAVALLGYTPWELAGGDFLKGFTGSPTGQSSLVSVLDRWGRRHELVHMPVKQADGSVWITVTPVPESLGTGWEDILSGWESRAPGNSLVELDATLGAIGATGGSIFERQGDAYSEIASRNSPVDEGDFSPEGLLASAGTESSDWMDFGDDDSGGHMFIKAFGRTGMYLGVFTGAASPMALEHKAAVALPILAMRLELASAVRSRVEADSRRSVLESIEKLLQERGTSSWQELSQVLGDISAQAGAARIEVVHQSAEQMPGAAAATADSADVAVLDVRMRGGRLLRFQFDAASQADTQMARAVARLLERFCHPDQPPAGRAPSFSDWRAAYVEGFRVLWQPEGSALPSCYAFYGREAPCEGCPVIRGTAGAQGQPAGHFREGWIEEIQQTGTGFSIRWTRWLGDPSEPGSEKLPGGAAVYDQAGAILSWSNWFETVSGIPASAARGQGAARILDRISGSRTVRQMELALADVFLPDSMEVTLPGGRRCFSKMSPGPRKGQVFHFLLDARSAGIEETQILAGPGAAGAEGEPSSLRRALGAVCEIYGWEMIAADEASDAETEVWLSSPALSEYLLDLLKQMAPMMPDRKASLRTADIPEGRMPSGKPILPGVYGIVAFRTYPVILPGQTALLSGMERDVASLGGWMAKSEDNGLDEIMVAFPVTGRDLGDRRQVTVYSTDEWFTGEMEAVMAGLSEPFCLATNLQDLSEMQLVSRALVLRLKPGETNIAACLAARVPGQSMIVASGVKPRIPLTVSSVLHLQMPATRDEIITALRRMIIA